MTNRLLQDNWGDNSKPYTEEELAEARARFRRRDRITLVAALTIALLIVAGVAGQILHHYWR
jgi:hypothetical protein